MNRRNKLQGAHSAFLQFKKNVKKAINEVF